MTDTDRMLTWLREAMDAAQRDAEAATPGPWEPKGEDPGDDEVYTVHDGEHGDLVGDVVAYVRGGAGRTLANQYLMANHADPVAVLRRIAADRKLLDDLLAEKHHVCDDNWYTCGAATEERDGGTYAETDGGALCNCGRDARVAHRVGLLAESWGWTPEAATKADADEAMSGGAIEIRMTDEEAERFERNASALVHYVRPIFEATLRERQRLLSDFFNGSPPGRTPQSPGCYEASWGWVHVKPGCHCPR